MKDTIEKIKRIDIVFENCEVAELEPSMFTSFLCESITKSYLINCYQYRKGEIIEEISCDYFSIFINKKGLKQKTKMGTFIRDILKNRIKNNDITHVDIMFENSNKYISVPWNGGTNYKNDLQKNTFDKDGLTIEIRR